LKDQFASTHVEFLIVNAIIPTILDAFRVIAVQYPQGEKPCRSPTGFLSPSSLKNKSVKAQVKKGVAVDRYKF
jgi:hypothetical protein